MSPLRARLMLVGLVALLAAPAWVGTAALGAAAAFLAARALRFASQRLLERRPAPSQAVVLGVAQGGRSVNLGGRSVTQGGRGVNLGGRSVTLSDHDLSAHGLILGASGSGKTTALLTILEQQIARGVPVVAIDMKGSPAFAARLAQAAAAAGRPFRLWSPDGPGFWNPLRHGNATEGKDKLVATERFSEPHYQRAAERYVQTLLQVLQHVHPGQPPTLDEVVGLMDPRRLPALLRSVPRELADRVQDYCKQLGPDQLSAVRGLQTRLAVITESTAGRYLKPAGETTIDLRAALDGPEVVLFSLNASRYGRTAAQLGTLVVQDVICATGLRLESHLGPAGPPLAVVAIDEFSGIGGEHVVALFARGREAGVGALVATQEMADLDRAGRGVRDQVIGSTALKLILRQDVPESARTVAQIAGTERVWEETRQIGGTLFPGPPGRGTRRQVEEFVIHPNVVKSLPTGHAVLISKLNGRPAEVIRVTPAAVTSAAVTPAAATPAAMTPPAMTPPAATPAVATPAATNPTASARKPAPPARSQPPHSRPEGERGDAPGRVPRSRYPDPGVMR